MPPLSTLLIFGLALVLGVAGGYFLRHLRSLLQKSSLELKLREKQLKAEERALKLIEEAEEKAHRLEEEVKREEKERENKIRTREERLDKKEELLDGRQIRLDSETEAARSKINEIKELKQRLDERAVSIDAKLEEVAALSKDEARAEVVAKLEAEQAEALANRLQKLRQAGEEAYETAAQNLILAAIHRVGNDLPRDVMTSAVELLNDDLKGKVIGREGRNVRAFERATGVDVLIDETPGYITLSSFDPVRREIARVALEMLLKDGRIQPARIEECVDSARKEVATLVRKMGEKAAYEAGVPNLHPDLIAILGRLHFRTSYGQNVLWHSVEMAHLAAILAEEIGADVAVARAGALLHDIGKTVSQEVAGTHVEIGIRILQKYGVDEQVILAMRAHHEEYPYETPESIIVQVADAISGGRPGARRDSIENYIKRLTDLEAIATNLEGVEKAFAIAAGRELRVLVNPETVNDLEANRLARQIALAIEAQLRYPGEIKVHVIRERRVTSYAR